MSRVTWEWLAGFTDGDGCIHIPEIAVKRPSQIKVTWYQRSSEGWLMEEIELFLAAYLVNTRRYIHHGSKISGEMIHLTVGNRIDTQLVLEELQPFLVLKQNKANRALELLKFQPPAGNQPWLTGKCQRGHNIVDEQNVYTAPNGLRSCRLCRRERGRVVKEIVQS